MKTARAAIAILLSLGFHAALAAVVTNGIAGGGDTRKASNLAVTVTLIEAPGETGNAESATEMPAPAEPETEPGQTPVEATAMDKPAEIAPPLPLPELPSGPPVVALAATDIARALPRLDMPAVAPAIRQAPESETPADLPQTVAVRPTPRPEITRQDARPAPRAEPRRKTSREASRPRASSGSSGVSGKDTASQRSAPGKAAGPSRAAMRQAMASYGQQVNSHVARRKPRSAGGRGTVGLTLRISRSGKLLGARVASSSGNRDLDDKALQAARRAAPYPQPPRELSGQSLALRIRLSFR